MENYIPSAIEKFDFFSQNDFQIAFVYNDFRSEPSMSQVNRVNQTWLNVSLDRSWAYFIFNFAVYDKGLLTCVFSPKYST